MSIFPSSFPRDTAAGCVVFIVALPLCLGIALASNAPLLSGVLAGIVGGIIVGALSRSHTSVSGPAAALAAIVASQIASLGSFSAFQVSLIVAGLFQVVFGLWRAGSLAPFIPSSVSRGFLAAIGLLLILKQIPHILGHDSDPQGEMAFRQPDNANTFTALENMFGHVHLGATIVGIVSIIILVVWPRWRLLRKSIIPAPLVVVVCAMSLGVLFEQVGGILAIESMNFVRVPTWNSGTDLATFMQWPDWNQLSNPDVYLGGFTLAIAASLGTVLNLESVDKLDPQQRNSPPSEELVAQGIGNCLLGLIGGIPITSEVVRGSVNVNAGAQTKVSAIVHGVLLVTSVILLPQWLNMIPLSALAAILLVTGAKLVSPRLFRKIWDQGRYQFIPFALTITAIIFTDMLTGVLIGLVISCTFILNSNLRRPVRRFIERHLGGDVLHIELANQVSFLNRAALRKILEEVPSGGHVLLDAQSTDYIDPDVLELIREFHERTAPARGVQVSLSGFKRKYQLDDRVQYVDYATRELQTSVTPDQVLKMLQEGHQRFRSGERLTRDLGRQVVATATAQHPLAVVLSCIDSRTPVELIFDLGVGDIFSIRIAGNIVSREVLGSIEYACAIAGAKLILVMGHTRCGAVTAAIENDSRTPTPSSIDQCAHLTSILAGVRAAITSEGCQDSMAEPRNTVEYAVRANAAYVAKQIIAESSMLRTLLVRKQVGIVSAIYDVSTGSIEYIPSSTTGAISDAIGNSTSGSG